MTSRSLAGRNVVVVGASAGIGRAFAVKAVQEGARVVVAARRSDRLAEVVATAGGGTCAVCDVAAPNGCDQLAEVVAAELGNIDLLVSAVGFAPLRLLEQATVEDWLTTLQTNLVGVNALLCASLPLLSAGSLVAVLSSESVGQHRPALGIYSASKAALDQLIGTWRAERPGIRFTRVVVGSTIDTEFGLAFPRDLLGWAMQDWQARGLLPENYLLSDDVAEAIAGALATALQLPDVGIDTLTVRPASRIAGTPDTPLQSHGTKR